MLKWVKQLSTLYEEKKKVSKETIELGTTPGRTKTLVASK